MNRLFTAVYAPTTMGTLLRGFTWGNVRQLQAVAARHLLALADRTPVLAGIDCGPAGPGPVGARRAWSPGP